MALTIDFSPTEETQIAAVAQQEGLEPTTYVRRLVTERLSPAPSDPVGHVQALLTRWQREDNTPTPPPVPTRPGETPTEALFRTWREEDTRMTLEEREAEDQLWQDFAKGIDETRVALGMRTLFDDFRNHS